MANQDVYDKLCFTKEQKEVVKPILGTDEKIIRRFLNLIATPFYRPVWNKVAEGKEAFADAFRAYELAKILGLKKAKKKRIKKKKETATKE
ncbi:MAG: hypothetical protein B5M53_05550 [Candidatus Cloacimonas sp. 4484_209]|nr:MAG: hypothetical protein B5M53_05550 [Candidatus Cloacimonas sp. 4484_209]